jgi:SAM-dependent methyltransferase
MGGPPGASRAAPQPADALRELIDGYRVTQAVAAAVQLGVPDLLADGPRSSGELAAVAGADAGSLERLLRALAGLGILVGDEEGRYRLTELGDPLRTGHPRSLAHWAAFVGGEAHWRGWGALAHSVRTGESAFRLVHGQDVWEYRAGHPEDSAVFDRAMAAVTTRDNETVVAAYPFGRFSTIVDVGGGTGSLLAAVLAANPGVRGAVLDLPHVVSGAAEVLEAAGVADRCEVVAGSFFESVPPADAYLLRSVIHDWDDPEAVAILETCARSLRPGGSVLLVERLLGAPNESPAPKLSDLNMLVGPGGRERTLEEFAALFAAAGLTPAGATPIGPDRAIVEATGPG